MERILKILGDVGFRYNGEYPEISHIKTFEHDIVNNIIARPHASYGSSFDYVKLGNQFKAGDDLDWMDEIIKCYSISPPLVDHIKGLIYKEGLLCEISIERNSKGIFFDILIHSYIWDISPHFWKIFSKYDREDRINTILT